MTKPATPASKTPSILDALTNPQLFGPSFKGDSWEVWKAFLAALFALPMTEGQLAAYKRHTGRETAPTTQFGEAALVIGRRGGKSRVLATIAAYLATFRDYSPYLAPGEVATVAVLASTRAQARSIFRYTSGVLKSVPALASLITDESNEAITLSNRVVIEIQPASFRATRGYSFAAVLCDEIAFWRIEAESANPDTEILRALRPGMASIPGAILLLASSPYAKKGALYEAFRRHHGKDKGRVLVWQAATQDMNPQIDPEIIAEAYESDPEAARAEYGAEFRDDLADFVTREAIDAVTMWGRLEVPLMGGVTYQAFADPSGGANDAFTLAVAHLEGDVGVLDAILEIRPPFDPDVAVSQCAELLKRYNIKRVTGDRYAGEWPVSRFASHGITFDQSAKPKSDIYHDFLPLVNSRRIELLESTRLAAQLCGLERRTSRSGRDSIDHAPGGHDDLANAVAGVLVALELDRRPGLVKQDDLLIEKEALPVPAYCKAMFAVLAMSRDGLAATVFVALTFEATALVVDFDVSPLGGDLFQGLALRLNEMAMASRARNGGVMLFVQPDLERQAAVAGVHAYPIPLHLKDPDLLLLPAAGHIAGGRVKTCRPAHEKSRTSTFGGALDFRGGDGGDDPLRRAALWAISLALDPRP